MQSHPPGCRCPWVRVQSRMPAGWGSAPRPCGRSTAGCITAASFSWPRAPGSPPPSGALPCAGAYRLTTVSPRPGSCWPFRPGMKPSSATRACWTIHASWTGGDSPALPELFWGMCCGGRFINPDPCLVQRARPYQPGDPPDAALRRFPSARARSVKTCAPPPTPSAGAAQRGALRPEWATWGSRRRGHRGRLSLAATMCLLAIDRGACGGWPPTPPHRREEEALLAPGRSTCQRTRCSPCAPA